jgi:hypothetical protein
VAQAVEYLLCKWNKESTLRDLKLRPWTEFKEVAEALLCLSEETFTDSSELGGGSCQCLAPLLFPSFHLGLNYFASRKRRSQLKGK